VLRADPIVAELECLTLRERHGLHRGGVEAAQVTRIDNIPTHAPIIAEGWTRCSQGYRRPGWRPGNSFVGLDLRQHLADDLGRRVWR